MSEAPPAPVASEWREIAQRLRELAEKAPPSIDYIEGPRSNLVHVETGERHPDGQGIGLFSVPKKHIAYIDLFYELLKNLPTILDALSAPPGSSPPPPPEAIEQQWLRTAHEQHEEISIAEKEFVDELRRQPPEPDFEAMVEVASKVLDQADEGPVFCMGVMSDGSKVWKGSFLERLEKLRAVLQAARPSAPEEVRS